MKTHTKIIVFLLLLTLSISFSSINIFASSTSNIIGDVDCSQKVNVRDATAIQKYLAKVVALSENELKLADTDSNSKINIKDATGIQKWLAKLLPNSKIGTKYTGTSDTIEIPGSENYHGHVYTGGASSTKYHYEADCAGKYSHEITWDEVNSRNLTPCKTCVLK